MAFLTLNKKENAMVIHELPSLKNTHHYNFTVLF